MYPHSKEWVCNAGNIFYNVTLQGGIRAGQFKKIGPSEDMNTCTRFCCEDRQCDVAFMAKQNCYLVSCLTNSLCESVPTDSPKLFPRLSYVTRTFFNTHTKTSANREFENAKRRGTFGDVADDTISKKNSFNNIDISESQNLKRKLKSFENNKQSINYQNGKKNKINKAIEIAPKISPTKEQEISVHSQGCYAAKVHKGVSLRYGTQSGEFYDYGEIADMRMCVDLCCKDKKCDVAFMVGKTCYTISCSSFDFCQMVPSIKKPGLTTQLAYVIKKRSVEGKQKLLITQDHEKFLSHQISRKSHTKNQILHSHARPSQYIPSEQHDIEMGTPKSDIFAFDEPNIPKKFRKGCRSNRILNNYGLIGGQRAGVYTLRGITPDFDSCIGLCCAEMMCDAAFLLGRRCFSVQCFRNGACAGRPAATHGMRSKLAFVDRKDDDIGESKYFLPVLDDRDYSVLLLIQLSQHSSILLSISKSQSLQPSLLRS